MDPQSSEATSELSSMLRPTQAIITLWSQMTSGESYANVYYENKLALAVCHEESSATIINLECQLERNETFIELAWNYIRKLVGPHSNS